MAPALPECRSVLREEGQLCGDSSAALKQGLPDVEEQRTDGCEERLAGWWEAANASCKTPSMVSKEDNFEEHGKLARCVQPGAPLPEGGTGAPGLGWCILSNAVARALQQVRKLVRLCILDCERTLFRCFASTCLCCTLRIALGTAQGGLSLGPPPRLRLIFAGLLPVEMLQHFVPRCILPCCMLVHSPHDVGQRWPESFHALC